MMVSCMYLYLFFKVLRIDPHLFVLESGEGTERENLAVEKEFETALAKGYRPCNSILFLFFSSFVDKPVYWLGPTCKKMMDMKSADKVFKSAAFGPTDEELREYARSKRRERKERDIEMRSPSPARSLSPTSSIPDVFDDSDDDLPDVAQMLKKRKEKMQSTKSKVSIFQIAQRVMFLFIYFILNSRLL